MRKSHALRVALVVPDYRFDWDDDRQCQVESLRARCKKGEIDLAVFPEDYECTIEDVEQWAEDLGVAVLVGVGDDEGFQLAVYRNPKAERGETREHCYVKHSTAVHLAYEWPGYAASTDAMFEPISIKGERIGVLICHDMFFGLTAHRERVRGATMFIDLSGGNVNEAKWTNVVRGRSLEMGTPFLCTMARREGEAGKAVALAYNGLRPYKPVYDSTRSVSRGGYSVIELTPDTLSVPDEGGQAYTDKAYADIAVALGTDVDADISVHVSGPRPGVSSNRHSLRRSGAWTEVLLPLGRVGVLAVPIEAIDDGTLIHRYDLGEGAFDHHLVVYAGERSTHSSAELLGLAKLRAIEYRLGVGILAGPTREMIKTNRYKNIQRFVEREGAFGLKAEFLGGLWSTASVSSRLGVPRDQFTQYLSLL